MSCAVAPPEPHALRIVERIVEFLDCSARMAESPRYFKRSQAYHEAQQQDSVRAFALLCRHRRGATGDPRRHGRRRRSTIALAAKRTALEQLKKSLMHDLLTGRVRVTNASKVAAS